MLQPLPNPKTDFVAKTWYRYVAAGVATFLFGFSLILGPLFLLGVVRPNNGRPGTEAGIALSLVGVCLGPVERFHRRHPHIPACAEAPSALGARSCARPWRGIRCPVEQDVGNAAPGRFASVASIAKSVTRVTLVVRRSLRSAWGIIECVVV